MPINYDKLLALKIPDVEHSYGPKDSMLYALGVGLTSMAAWLMFPCPGLLIATMVESRLLIALRPDSQEGRSECNG